MTLNIRYQLLLRRRHPTDVLALRLTVTLPWYELHKSFSGTTPRVGRS